MLQELGGSFVEFIQAQIVIRISPGGFAAIVASFFLVALLYNRFKKRSEHS